MRTLFKRPFEASFQAKILVPVLALLVLLPAITLVIVHRSGLEQMRSQAREAMLTANSLFQNSLDLLSRQLVTLSKNATMDPRFRAISALPEFASTMNDHLNERLQNNELGEDAEVVLFIGSESDKLAGASRNSRVRVHQFAEAVTTLSNEAAKGRPQWAAISLESQIFDVVAVPVSVNDRVTGVFVVGVRIGTKVLRELTFLIRGEGLFLAEGQVIESTLRNSLELDVLPHWNSRGPDSRPETAGVEIEKLHYLALASSFPGSAAGADVGYVLLVSYEAALRALRHTQNVLWLLSLLGLAVSTGAVLLLVRRVTSPLRELRNNAEAVGNGDFSRRITVRSSDELGQLSHAFNQMTRNLCTSRDELQKTVESLKTTQAQLIQSEKLSAVGEFVSGIAHELNNPLTSIIGFGELLKAAKIPVEYQKYLQYIVRSTERCHKIVHGLLSFARQHAPERKLINPNEMVDSVIEILAYELRTSNIEVERAFLIDPPRVMGDSHQLQQVILNILNNARQAIEAHQPSGRLCVSTERRGDTLRIVLQDNGPGISKENLGKIFNPFFTTKPIGKGTGLGLSLCYGIVREHGGTITADSSPGAGATFVIELPIHKGDDSSQENGRLAFARVNGAGKRALVVDDEEWILELVRQILNQDGFEVEVAGDGDTALHRVSERDYELLVCDWKMPGLSGPHLFNRIRAVNPSAADRVIFMTGDVANESFQQFLSSNSKDCLSKPFSVQEFRKTIGRFIESRN